MTAHTPGPWKYSTNVGPTRALIVEADGSTIVEMLNRTRDSRFEANARLIADAPTLLAALEAAYTFISQPQRMTPETATYRVHNYNALTAQIRAAIAAARKTP